MKNLEKIDKVAGTSAVIKKIYSNELKEILITSNCSEEIENKIIDLAKINEIPVKKIEEDSKKLGVLCKKTYNISVLGLLKESQ
jgi:ribosomal protein L30E